MLRLMLQAYIIGAIHPQKVRNRVGYRSEFLGDWSMRVDLGPTGLELVEVI